MERLVQSLVDCFLLQFALFVEGIRAEIFREFRLNMTSMQKFLFHQTVNSTNFPPRSSQILFGIVFHFTKFKMQTLPPNWEMRLMPSGFPYYLNHQLHYTQWWDPRINMPLPSGWEMRIDEKRATFFVNHLAKTTTYNDPRINNPALNCSPPPYSGQNITTMSNNTTINAVMAVPHIGQSYAAGKVKYYFQCFKVIVYEGLRYSKCS
jgi:hypothetical protein